MTKIVVVGFKVLEDNSVFYRKLSVDNVAHQRVIKAVVRAMEVSDFISIRVVHEEEKRGTV